MISGTEGLAWVVSALALATAAEFSFGGGSSSNGEDDRSRSELLLEIENLRTGLGRLQQLLMKLPIPFVGMDNEGTIYEWNGAAEEAFGKSLFEVFEQPATNHIFTNDDDGRFDAALKNILSGDQLETFELKTFVAGGREATFEWHIMGLRNVHGEVSSLVATALDVTERVAERERLSDLANKDALTGIANRRSVLETLEGAHAGANPASPVSIVLFDVDKFKTFNDTHGHPAGDALLRRAGEVLRTICQADQTPGRYGGEEFVIVLNNTSIDEALVFAERLRVLFAERTADLFGGATASFGVAATDDPEHVSIAELIQSADKALYMAKHQGRNRVVLAGSIPDEDAA